MGDNTFHSALSPSARHRWGACPGSVREEAKHPEPPSGPAALDGTRTHSILEQCVRLGQRIAPEFIGSVARDEHGEYRWDADRIARVNVALDYIWTRPNGSKAIAETRVYPDGLVLRADMSGTVDVQIPGDPYEVIDYKDGMGQVVVENNPQLEQYAMGVLAGLPVESRPKSFRLTVIQPKLAMKGLPPITSYDITTDELLARVEVAKAQAAATDDPNAPLVPGEAQCKYCKAKGSCVALAGKALSEVSLMFPAIAPQHVITPIVEVDVATQAASRDPGKMTDQQLRQIQEAAPLVRQLLDGVNDEIERRLSAGIPVAGFKLVRGNGQRGWSLPEEEMVKKLTGMQIPKGAIYTKKLITPAQAEKLVWDKDGEAQKLSEKQIKKMVAEYVTTSPGKVTVAPESDPRPAVTVDASSLFGAVTPAPAPSLPPWMAAAPAPTPAPEPAPSLPPWMLGAQ